MCQHFDMEINSLCVNLVMKKEEGAYKNKRLLGGIVTLSLFLFSFENCGGQSLAAMSLEVKNRGIN